jgi:hypothetical protein
VFAGRHPAAIRHRAPAAGLPRRPLARRRIARRASWPPTPRCSTPGNADPPGHQAKCPGASPPYPTRHEGPTVSTGRLRRVRLNALRLRARARPAGAGHDDDGGGSGCCEDAAGSPCRAIGPGFPCGGAPAGARSGHLLARRCRCPSTWPPSPRASDRGMRAYRDHLVLTARDPLPRATSGSALATPCSRLRSRVPRSTSLAGRRPRAPPATRSVSMSRPPSSPSRAGERSVAPEHLEWPEVLSTRLLIATGVPIAGGLPVLARPSPDRRPDHR